MCCLDPFGMLDPQVVVNLLPAPGVVDERSCRERTKWPSEGTPQGGTRMLAVCATPCRLDHFLALALQQHGQQSALRKGRRGGHNVVFHKRLLILRFDSSPDGFPYGTLVLCL